MTQLSRDKMVTRSRSEIIQILDLADKEFKITQLIYFKKTEKLDEKTEYLNLKFTKKKKKIQKNFPELPKTITEIKNSLAALTVDWIQQ